MDRKPPTGSGKIMGTEGSPEAAGLFADILEKGCDLRVRVSGSSMAPFIRTGDVVTIRKVPVHQLKIGDLVLCRRKGDGMTLHRLIRITKGVKNGNQPILYTKGDALHLPDPPAKGDDDFLGKVVRLTRLRSTPLVAAGLLGPSSATINYVLAVYHRLKSDVICRYLRYKSGRQAGRRFQQYFLSLLSGPGPVFPVPKDWGPFLRFISNQHLQGLLYLRLKHQKGVPDSVMRFLERAYYAGLAANTVRVKQIEALEPHLAEANLNILVIKGAALLSGIYPDPGMRPMEDIDLVIDPENLQAMGHVLRRAGYVRDPVYDLMFYKNGVSLDLHTHLLHTDRIAGRKQLLAWDMERVWDASLPWHPEYRYIRRPDDVDHLIFLAHHMIKHSFSKLIWIVDAHKILGNRDHAFWQKLGQKTAIYQQERPVAYMMYLLEKMSGVKPPESSDLAVHQQILSRFEKAVLNIKVNGGSIGDLGNLLWMFCIRGFKKRLGFMKESLFPRRGVLQREYPGITDTDGPRLYLHRWRQIILQFGKNIEIIAGEILHR